MLQNSSRNFYEIIVTVGKIFAGENWTSDGLQDGRKIGRPVLFFLVKCLTYSGIR